LAWILPGLFWSQLLILFVACLLVASLAALTTGFVPFIFAALAILVVALGIEQIMVPPSLPAVRGVIDGVQWIWDTGAGLLLAAGALVAIWIQFSKRATSLSRRWAISAACLAAAVYLFVPWPWALALQRQISRGMPETAAMHVELLGSQDHVHTPTGRAQGVELYFPMKLNGLPPGITVEPEAWSVSLHGANRWNWQSGVYQLPVLAKGLNRRDPTALGGSLVMPASAYSAARQQKVTLKGSLYLTLFGNEQSKMVPLMKTGTNVMEGLQCGTGELLSNIYCASPFRWPKLQAFAKSQDGYLSRFQHEISYSPFPADFSFDTFAGSEAAISKDTKQLTIVTREPLKTVRLDFEARDIKLADFEGLPIVSSN
jgi:hypothetical protein